MSPDDLAALISNAFPATKPGASQSKDVSAESTQKQIDRLEARVEDLEKLLGKILEHIGLSREDAQAGRPHLGGFESTGLKRNHRSDLAPKIVTTTQTGPYVYSPLDPSKSQLRILCIHRAEHLSDPLVAELETVGLDDSSIKALMYGFSALSYTWGPPVFDGTILVNGHEFPITISLEQALKRLRDEYKDNATIEINGRMWGRECWIWVDQICMSPSKIDQVIVMVLTVARYQPSRHR